MAIRVGINGFGRIGRCVFKAGIDDKEIDFVAVNDITTPEVLAHLLEYDSTYGRTANVEVKDDKILICGREVKALCVRDPAQLPWDELGVDIVVESTGIFRKREDAKKHLDAGAKKVIISAPATNPDITIVMGVNHEKYDTENHNIISGASCTTNCIAPLAKVLHENFGIQKGFMTTIHAYTSDQKLVDGPHRDKRRARSAAINIVPTTTGAAIATTLVIPELKGKMDGMAMRVPVHDGSIVDFVAFLERDVTIEEVNQAMKKASEEPPLKGILQYSNEPLVSCDIIGNLYSSVYDSLATMVIGNMVKVLGWYDNEMAYSKRVNDMIKYIAEKGY